MNYFTCIGTCRRIASVFDDEMTMRTKFDGIEYCIDVGTKTNPMLPFCYTRDTDSTHIKLQDKVNMWDSKSEELKSCEWEYDFDAHKVLYKISVEIARLGQCINTIQNERYNVPFYRCLDILRDATRLMQSSMGMRSKNLVVWVNYGSNDFECRAEDESGKPVCGIRKDGSYGPLDMWGPMKDEFINARYMFGNWFSSIPFFEARLSVLYKAFNRLYRELNMAYYV